MYNRMVCLVCVCVCWLGGGLKSGPGCKTAWKSLSFCVFAAPAVLSDICFVGGKHKRQQKKKSKNKNWLFFFRNKKGWRAGKMKSSSKMKVFWKTNTFSPSQFLDLFCEPTATSSLFCCVCFTYFCYVRYNPFLVQSEFPHSSRLWSAV